MDISVEHMLLFLIFVFLFYHLIRNCGCVNKVDGFSGSPVNPSPPTSKECSRALLNTMCFNGNDKEQCMVCTGPNQRKLRLAGCGEADLENYCDKTEACDKTLNKCKNTNEVCSGCHRCPGPPPTKWNCGCYCPPPPPPPPPDI